MVKQSSRDFRRILSQITGCLILLFVLSMPVTGQCPHHAQLNEQVETSERNNKDTKTRLKNLYEFKRRIEDCKLLKDSIYAKILHKIGILEYQDNHFIPTENSFAFTAEAVRINTSGIKTAYPAYATKSFSNLAVLYSAAGLNREAVRFCDSTLEYGKRYPEFSSFLRGALELKAFALFKTGDYQGSIDQLLLGIKTALESGDSLQAAKLYNKRAEAYKLQGDNKRAMKDALWTMIWIETLLKTHRKEVLSNPNDFNDYYRELANAYKVKALATETDQPKSDEPKAELKRLIRLSNHYQAKTGDSSELSNNFNDFGAYYFSTYHDYKSAKENYIQSMRYGKNSKWNLAFGYLNLGAADFPAGDYAAAGKNYLKMLSLIGFEASNILENQPVARWMAVPYKQLVHVFLNNKTELLLGLYKKTNNKKYLEACLSTALVTDSVIQLMRREQTAEQSKLLWRNKTRNFFTNALEACLLAKNYPLAFYFMEKSRSVILADKLNELGAASLLPVEETVREQLFRQAIANEEEHLRALSPNDHEYDSVSARLIEARHQLNNHITSLEKKYPEYYKYKFSGDVLSYDQFKVYLKNKKTGFVSYFLGDTTSYILSISGGGITAEDVKMIKVPASAYNKKQLDALLGIFADASFQNRRYDSLVLQSHEFYKKMFAPLGIAKGNLIICPDGFMLPFDALHSDASGNKTLLEEYSISYAYSANSLITKFIPVSASQNFVGFAPVSFKPYLNLAALNPSADFLDEAASNYSSTKLFIRQESSRKNFLSNLGSYRIVNVFSHASTGNNDEEPILYMEDSVIRLSELQDIDQVRTQLVVLSACQTSSGKNAIGEGIYSLSRGFAAAGIPSVMATIWRADEHPVYRISILFHKNIAAGMRKDDALRLAKIDYLKTANKERSLPYYWANMVIMGNTDPIELVHRNYLPWILAFFSLLGLIIGLSLWRKRVAGKK
ncbi:CHAT domain-containing protein [Flavitalea sp.]|nr:CHAT domain-containing protein [Flavitalea sp.]